jgi:hypothetical protein
MASAAGCDERIPDQPRELFRKLEHPSQKGETPRDGRL